MEEEYAFFEGLSGEGVSDTLTEYTANNAKSSYVWQMKTMGHNAAGFWVLFARIKRTGLL